MQKIKLENGRKVITELINSFIENLEMDVSFIAIQVADTNAAIICCEDNEFTIQDLRNDLTRLIPTQTEILSEDPEDLATMIRSSIIGRTLVLSITDNKIRIADNESIQILGFPQNKEEVSIMWQFM